MNLGERTLELVRVESPTGDTADAAHLYAEWLRDAGLEVEVRGDDYLILRERDIHAVASPRLDGAGTGLYL